ncbi:enoyl-CoA hydratase/isomerase family protein [Nocardioides immobilis]|uniref:enoyl-CoA hydratase/isomerase family protein n=1 Tax=Nocardioides immobilis TaxID=2049295 RepID=UPI0015F9B83E|nr:enoyl-CoA hydratase/isomerase family protein [Nocardioides immobilis]
MLHVRMSSPPVNAFSAAFFDDLHAVLASAGPEIGAVVISSTVERVFAAGGDIPFMARADEPTSENYVRRCQEVYGLLERPEVVSIMAIDGACLGGGLELSLAADIRIASPSSRLGLPEVSLGILAGGGAIHRLVRAVGQGVARDLLLTGEPISAKQAHMWGLVNRLAADPLAAALALAEKVGSFSPEAVGATKVLALSASTDEFEDGLRDELARWVEVRRGANAQEGLDAFAQRRAPRFERRHA